MKQPIIPNEQKHIDLTSIQSFTSYEAWCVLQIANTAKLSLPTCDLHIGLHDRTISQTSLATWLDATLCNGAHPILATASRHVVLRTSTSRTSQVLAHIKIISSGCQLPKVRTHVTQSRTWVCRLASGFWEKECEESKRFLLSHRVSVSRLKPNTDRRVLVESKLFLDPV